jgi:hypothetical protein
LLQFVVLGGDRSSVLLVVQFHHPDREPHRLVVGRLVAVVEVGDELPTGIHNRGEVQGGLLGYVPHGFSPDLYPDGVGVVFVIRLPDQGVGPDIPASKGFMENDRQNAILRVFRGVQSSGQKFNDKSGGYNYRGR